MTISIPTLETHRLLLRPPMETDLDVWASAFFGDPDVARYISKRPLTPAERAERALRVARESWAVNGVGGWVLEDKRTGEFVGAINIGPMAEGSQEIEIGYGLVTAYWGMGLATEAAGAATRYTFEYTKIPRLLATVMPENTASCRVLEKLGYTVTDEFPLAEGLRYYILHKEDYNGQWESLNVISTQNWQKLDEPGFRLTFRYPVRTPKGYEVTIEHEAPEGVLRTHLLAQQEQEIYFEVRKYSGETIEQGYAHFRAGLAQQPERFEMSELSDAMLAGKSAQRFSVQFPTWRREGYYVELDEDLYRIIFDPMSGLNRVILGTVEVG